jgi:hypothetical protein
MTVALDLETMAAELAREHGKTLPAARAALRAAMVRLARTLHTDEDLDAMTAELARRCETPIPKSRAALRMALVRLAEMLSTAAHAQAPVTEAR